MMTTERDKPSKTVAYVFMIIEAALPGLTTARDLIARLQPDATRLAGDGRCAQHPPVG
jgi:hypothetical protein